VTPLPRHEREALIKWIEETFGIPRDKLDPLLMFKRGRDIWMASSQLQEVLDWNENHGTGPLPITRMGTRLARQDRQSHRLTTPAIQILGQWATKRVIDLSLQEAERYIRGEDITLDSPPEIPRGQVIVRVQGRPLGSGLLDGNKIKNQIPVAQRIKR